MDHSKDKSKKRNHDKVIEYYDSRGWINLEKFSEDTPCPICNTVITELKGTKIGEYFKSRKKAGESDPFVCNICVQKLVN